MKKKATWHSIRGAIVLLMMLTVCNMTMAQSKARLIDPSISNPNYDSEKLQKHHQMRVRNNADIDEAQEPKEINSNSVDASSVNKATSTCFIPLDGSYTSIPRNDDGSFGPIALPFTFDLYGSSYNQVWINTNGNLTFNGPYAVYSASGFPFSQPMVAPFWGDVDTRNLAGGQIYYKLSATNLIVTWDNVGYYNQQVDKLNEFQVVISDGVDPITGLGQNVCFNYGDMQWTTGSASSGVNGFGGTPATVGVNKGNNIDYYQLGRFNLNSSVYDGPGGNPDGINYLDQQCYCSQVSSAVNIAPIANNFPQDTITIACGDTYTLDFSFIPPEVNQTVTATVNVNGTCGTNYSTTSGSIANVNFSLVGQQCNEGVNAITFTATDNGTPVESTTVTLYVEVETCCNLSATASAQNESCANQADGSISVVTSGGTAPISYSIDGGVTYSPNSNFTGLATGTYVVVAKDANGCESAPQTLTITGPSALVTTSSASSISCNGGSATVTVSATGGTAPYTGVGTFTVSAGTYSFTVTDANGCTSTTTGVVSEPTALSASASSTAIACNGGSSDITVTATGGTAPYTGTGVYTETAGTHVYTVVDANGCTVDVIVTVTEPTALSASATSTAIACNGGTSDITVTATGGTAPYTGTGVYTETAGTYVYTVVDANGCTVDVIVTVAEPTALSASATSTAIACNGGTSDITVTATGGTAPYTGTGVYSETAGTHVYTVVDANGCTVDVIVTVAEPTALSASATSTAIACNGGTSDITVTATGGTAPYTGTGVYTETAGTYVYTVVDANGCTVDVIVTVAEPTALSASATSTAIACNGGTSDITVTATGGTAPYTGTGIYTETAGTHVYTVVDANGCTVDVIVTVTEPAALSASASSTAILCNGGSADVTVTATGGTEPYTGTGSFNVTAGTYTYTVTDANGCSSDVTITVAEPAALSASASSTAILCNGGSADVTVTATGGTAPYTGTGVYSVTAGTYVYTVVDANGCTVDVIVTVTEPTAVVASASSTVIPCFGGSSDVTVTATGGTAPYSGTGVYSVSAGTYTYTVTDANGCTADVTIVVDQPAQIEANITPQNHVIDCIPIPVTLTANPTGGTGGPYTYLWSTGETTASIEVNPNTTTTYTVQITDANGCTANASTNGTTVTVLNRCGNNNQKVVICHVPHGNTGNPQTICISPNALNPHLSTLWDLHGGDYCGPCQETSALTLGNTNEGDNTFIRAAINTNTEAIELSYRIGYDSPVRVEIYDMAGTLIDVVHSGQANEGELYEYKVTSDKISSGVYIYQFITNNEKHIDKLQIIK